MRIESHTVLRIFALIILLANMMLISSGEHFRIVAVAHGDLESLRHIVEGVSSICAIGVPGPLWALSEAAIPIVAGDEDTTPIPSTVAMVFRLGNGRIVFPQVLDGTEAVRRQIFPFKGLLIMRTELEEFY